MEENKTRLQKFKENPLSWMFNGDLFFLTLNSIFLLMVIFIIISIFSSIFSNNLVDPEGKALVINPNGPIVEQISGPSDPFQTLLMGEQSSELYVGDLLEVLEAASNDKRIKDLVLRLDNISGTGQAVLYDVGLALKKVKESGKRIIAIGDEYSESGFYLASFADEIILATATSNRHAVSVSEKLVDCLKENKFNIIGVEGETGRKREGRVEL